MICGAEDRATKDEITLSEVERIRLGQARLSVLRPESARRVFGFGQCGLHCRHVAANPDLKLLIAGCFYTQNTYICRFRHRVCDDRSGAEESDLGKTKS